jgi:hypothetical protein
MKAKLIPSHNRLLLYFRSSRRAGKCGGVVERFRFKVLALDVNALLTIEDISAANSVPSSLCPTYLVLEAECMKVRCTNVNGSIGHPETVPKSVMDVWLAVRNM